MPYDQNPRINDNAVDAVAASHVEKWMPVPSFKDIYEVSTTGQVRRSSPSRTHPPGFILKPQSTHDGYVKYSLRKDGRYFHRTGHRLVALAFLGSPPFPNAQVAHNDGNRQNNCLSNLRWATPSENEADKKRHGTDRGAYPGERHHNAKLNASLVARMRRDVIAGMTKSHVARKYGVPNLTAYDAIVGKTWKTVTDPKPLNTRSIS